MKKNKKIPHAYLLMITGIQNSLCLEETTGQSSGTTPLFPIDSSQQ